MPQLTGACRRCHLKKVKCDQVRPSCRLCTQANVPCLPHHRVRRIAAQKDSEEFQRRLTWLQESLSKYLLIDIKSIRTGTDLGPYLQTKSHSQVTGSRTSSLGVSPLDTTQNEHAGAAGWTPASTSDAQEYSSALEETEDIAIDTAPDVSLLTLNASGELRYLGPSSGSFFADYASSLARILVRKDGFGHVTSTSQDARTGDGPGLQVVEAVNTVLLTTSISSRLLDYFFNWVHSIFPLLGVSDRQLILNPLCSPERQAAFANSGDYVQQVHLTMFYLCLALGAAHISSSWNSGVAMDGNSDLGRANMAGTISADQLFIKAMEIMNGVPQMEKPGIPFIQILLLICIYGAYRPSGRGQWQLSGRALRNAIEIGLHRQGSSWNFTAEEVDLRRRVFWTAYVVELTAAFNLGRPPSISDEHIDALFPDETPETAMAIHHIRHRQTQSKILAKIYCSPNRLTVLDEAQKYQILNEIQSELDTWLNNLPGIYARSQTPYPLKYWERLYYSTTAAIHRPSPLFPTQSPESASLCIRSAGRYIDCHYDCLKTGNVPQSWMLVQGILLSGLTMIITARINRSLFQDRIGCSVLEIIEWNRKCSVVLNIISERWTDKTIDRSESKFNLVAKHTLEQLLSPNTGSPRPIQKDDISPSISRIGIGGHDFSEFSRPFPAANPPNQESMLQEATPSGIANQNSDKTNVNGMRIEAQLQSDNGQLSDPFSLEGLFGGDDLFSFWDVFPDSSEMTYFSNS